MIRRVVPFFQQLINGEPQDEAQLYLPNQEASEQDSIVQESLEQRELSSKLVIGRRSVKMQEQESTAEMESCEQRDFSSSKLILRRGSVKIQGQKLAAFFH